MHISNQVLRGIAVATVAATLLTSCSGGDDKKSDSKPTAIVLDDVKDVPGVMMIDGSKPWPKYSTAKIVQVQAGAGGRTINVNYQAGPDICTGFAGYSVERKGSQAAVTVILGRQKSCPGKNTERTTVLPVPDGLGDAKPTISKYSRQAIAVK